MSDRTGLRPAPASLQGVARVVLAVALLAVVLAILA